MFEERKNQANHPTVISDISKINDPEICSTKTLHTHTEAYYAEQLEAKERKSAEKFVQYATDWNIKEWDEIIAADQSLLNNYALSSYDNDAAEEWIKTLVRSLDFDPQGCEEHKLNNHLATNESKYSDSTLSLHSPLAPTVNIFCVVAVRLQNLYLVSCLNIYQSGTEAMSPFHGGNAQSVSLAVSFVLTRIFF